MSTVMMPATQPSQPPTTHHDAQRNELAKTLIYFKDFERWSAGLGAWKALLPSVSVEARWGERWHSNFPSRATPGATRTQRVSSAYIVAFGRGGVVCLSHFFACRTCRSCTILCATDHNQSKSPSRKTTFSRCPSVSGGSRDPEYPWQKVLIPAWLHSSKYKKKIVLHFCMHNALCAVGKCPLTP